ncbi:MAG TPA: carbamoyl phosphate synthase small subunit [Candidatus Egerieicola pullicola]|uniref:Carbamoyl phosphate synthase small chain n=1 Tax=Candidatus Egerieicola pullicola TaxID=2840775 RepID=A0A9D1AKZ4_9FIRM|nr:carbamoyl phosphate synthase small subunit [Candidatus Egerieicola pullicola]
MLQNQKKAWLVLANGMVLEGKSMGCTGTVVGEIVFATGMTGYQETLTDPSYYGQIVIQTFPLVGNYGINSMDGESQHCWLKGYIVREWCEVPSNFRCEETLDVFLKQQQVIGLYDVDTRHLTKIIRETGVMNGAITTDENYVKEALLEQIRAFSVKDAVKSVTCPQPEEFPSLDHTRKVVLFDFGYKFNIRRELVKRGCDVIVVPAYTTAEQIKQLNPDGIMLSNGPGDPSENVEIVENLKEIMKLNIPIFGICLGHQLMALANGAKTEKLKYGHRGANQPVIDLDLDRTFVTSQNHGYAVISDSLPKEVGYVSHKNANDSSCEGVRYTHIPAFTVQFHPEACGGPQDTAYLFDEFIALMDKKEG